METSDRKQGGRDYQAAGVWGVVRARGGRLYISQSVCVGGWDRRIPPQEDHLRVEAWGPG